MRQYPIWVDMVNNSYNSSKSYGVNDYNIQNIIIIVQKQNWGGNAPNYRIFISLTMN